MSARLSNRPDTVMGRALAARALALASMQQTTRPRSGKGLLDLTLPATTMLPEHVRQSAKDALDRGETHYTSRPGVPELRRAIAERSTEQGFAAVADTTVVTNGGAEAIYIALQAVLSANSTALVIEPVAPHVIEMITFIGAKIERLVPNVEERFVPNVDAIARSSANVLVLSSPSLISGVAIPNRDLAASIGAAIARGMEVILDRSGVPCLYDPHEARFADSELGSKVITIGSFSAGYGLDGWRVGYFTAPSDRVGKLRGLKQAMSICTTAVSQYAALAALEGPDDWLTIRREGYRTRLATAVELLRSSPFAVVNPDAYPALLIDAHQYGPNDREVAERLARDCGIKVDPGSGLGSATAGFIRIDLGIEESVFRTGIDRLAMVRNGAAHE